MKYDLIIIGAGPAGISAAIYAKSRQAKVLLIEKNQVGGIIGKVSTVTHYSAIIPGETGSTFAKRMEAQVLQAGVEIVYETVTEVSLAGETKRVVTNQRSYEAEAVILANGSTPRKLNIPGELELDKHGIGLNVAKDGHGMKEKISM